MPQVRGVLSAGALLLLLMVAGADRETVRAEGGVGVRVDPPTVQASPGTTVFVSLQATAPPQKLGAWDVSLGYDAGVVAVTDCQSTVSICGGDIRANPYRISGASLQGLSGMVDLADITFKVTGGSGSRSALTVTIANFVDPDVERIPNPEAGNGLITVAAGAVGGGGSSSSLSPSASPSPSPSTSASPSPSAPPGSQPSGGPAILAPLPGTVVNDLAPLLRWSNPAGTTQYQVQVIPFNQDGPGINLIRNADDHYQVQPPAMGQGNYVLLPGMAYVWRVRTNRSPSGLGENDPGWSEWAQGGFATGPRDSSGIRAVSPAEGAVAASRTPTVVWENSARDVFYYEVQLSRDPAFNTDPATATAMVYWELRHGGISSPPDSYTVPRAFPLAPGAVYYWRVRPRIQGDGTPVAWSNIFSFRTG